MCASVLGGGESRPASAGNADGGPRSPVTRPLPRGPPPAFTLKLAGRGVPSETGQRPWEGHRRRGTYGGVSHTETEGDASLCSDPEATSDVQRRMTAPGPLAHQRPATAFLDPRRVRGHRTAVLTATVQDADWHVLLGRPRVLFGVASVQLFGSALNFVVVVVIVDRGFGWFVPDI